jgi:hypothetical protein
MRPHQLLALLALGSVGAGLPLVPSSKASLLPVAPPIPLPCGIADPAGRTGFFASVSGGIDAVDLKTGELLWETTEAQRPLLLAGTRLLAQAGVQRNRLRILAFDLTQNGACVLESDPVVLPGWVVTAEAPGRSFTAHWRLDRNQLLLAWEASAWYTGTTRPTPKQEAAARKHAAGTARIDLDSGRVEVGPAEPPAQHPAVEDFPELDKKAIRWQGIAGGRRCAILLEESSSQQKLLLRSWDAATGKEAEPKELLRGKRLLLQPTLDGRLLLLRDAGNTPDENNLGKDRTDQFWTLVSPELGAAVARLPFSPGTQAVAVLGLRVYYAVSGPVRGSLDRPLLQPRTVRAYDLKTGKQVWERAVAGKVLAPPAR